MTKTWWRDAAIYQIYPRSFQDTNGDGEGDLAGVIERLPFLAGLGVDALWLSPFYKSPNRDGGYDVSDPRDIDPRFGSLVDAKELILKTHEHGMKIIFDIVPNHFSSDHIWFQEALKSKPGSPSRNRFHFYDGRGPEGNEPPNNWNSVFGGPSWSRVKEADGSLGQWYLHLFDSSQPDLNWENPEVAEDFEKTLRFWLDLGIDGFRIDVAHGLAKDAISQNHPDPEGLTRALRLDVVDMEKTVRENLLKDIPFFDRDGVHQIYRQWRKILDSYEGDRMSVAEILVFPTIRGTRYVRPDELHQIFNFDFLVAPWDATMIKESIDRTLREVATVGAPATWVLCNHDSSRIVSRLGDSDKAKALSMILHALPGGLYIYQGEELGLPDADVPSEFRQDPVFFRSNGSDNGRDGCRVPLPWLSAAENYGFSTGSPWLPQPKAWADYAVDVESADPNSFLNFYKKSLALRKSHPALGGEDSIQWIESPESVLHFQRSLGLQIIANLGAETYSLNFTSEVEILHSSQVEIVVQDGVLNVPSNTTVWLQF